MSTPELPKDKLTDLDFEVFREPWNKYGLKDGTSIKSRLILHKVMLRQSFKMDGGVDKRAYGVENQIINVVYNVPDSLKTKPSTATYTPDELEKAVVMDDIPYDTLAQEWNEYLVEDGTKIRFQLTLFRAARTSLADKNGNPVYILQSGATAAINPKKQ